MASSWPPPEEWPKLDLPKRHLIRLGLVWTVPFTPWAEEQFGELLDATGSFIAVLAYSRSKTPHVRLETAQITAEGDALRVTVQYRCDTEGLPPAPRTIQEAAWLIEPLMEVRVASAVDCHADFTFPDSGRLRTVVPLPSPAAVFDANRYAVDEIRGIRGVKHEEKQFGLGGYAFTLDRLASGDVALSLDFAQEAGPPYEAAEAALRNAEFIARRLAWEARRKPRAAQTPEEADAAAAVGHAAPARE